FDSSEEDNNRQLVNMINAELVSLNDHNDLISDKLNTFEELLKDRNNTHDKNYFMKDWEVRKNTNASEQPWTCEVIMDIVVQYFQHLHKDYLALKKNPDAFNNQNIKQRHDNPLLKVLDQYSDEEDLHYPKEEIKLILHKHCMSPELTDEEYQELHLQDKKQLIVAPMYWRSDEHNRIRSILNEKAGIQCPSRWSPYSKGKEKDNGVLKRVYPESDHSQYDELIYTLICINS
ncbi:33034_t:CDS:2, partial [Racocetra persica]